MLLKEQGDHTILAHMYAEYPISSYTDVKNNRKGYREDECTNLN